MSIKINKLFKKLWQKMHQDPVETYLAQSTDIVDLEHRMRNIFYKQANNINYGAK
jgi:hypothetical protein